jgi:small subunit ribosomal protein S4e
MTRKGETKQLKRFSAPKFWSLPRKVSKFATKPSSGPHSAAHCIPLLVILRDILKVSETAWEAKHIIKTGTVKIDGTIQKDHRFPVGLMDVIEIPKINLFYRMLPAPRRGLILHPIESSEAGFKLCRIENKTVIKGGNVQLNLHDGRNILIQVKDPMNPEEDIYSTKDVLKIAIPSQEILEHIKFEENCLSLVIDGRNLGLTGNITKIDRRFGPHASNVTLERDGKSYMTALDYAFPVGSQQSIISLPK